MIGPFCFGPWLFWPLLFWPLLFWPLLFIMTEHVLVLKRVSIFVYCTRVSLYLVHVNGVLYCVIVQLCMQST